MKGVIVVFIIDILAGDLGFQGTHLYVVLLYVGFCWKGHIAIFLLVLSKVLFLYCLIVFVGLSLWFQVFLRSWT